MGALKSIPIPLLLVSALLGCPAESAKRECPDSPAPLICGTDGDDVCDDPCGCASCSTEYEFLESGGRTYLCTPQDCYVEVRSEREFQGIRTSGPTSRTGSCGGIEDGEVTFRFVLMADDGTAIRPGEVLKEVEVDITADALAFSDSVVFEAGDVACSGSCEQTAMTCSIAPGIPETMSLARCQLPAEVVTNGPAEFVDDPSQPWLFGMVVENSGSLEGWLPMEVGVLYPDWDGDGTAEGSDDPGINPSRASDRNRQARAALAVLIHNWTTTIEGSPTQLPQPTRFGLWEFSGTSADTVISLVGEDPWTDDPAVAEAARGQFTPARGTRANVFMAIDTVLGEHGYADVRYADYSKMLVVLVDGPDDMRSPDHDVDTVITRATNLGVRVFIIHLDASKGDGPTSSAPVFRDDPLYWAEQTPCVADSACKNFERCRVPTGYASSANAPVEIDPGGERYCMPERDPETGRLGPMAEYGRIACETEGGYIYVKEGSGLRPRMDWLPFAAGGLWQVDTVVGALGSGDLAPNRAYSLQTTLSVSIGDATRQYSFSQTGEPISADDGADTRAVLFD